MFTLQQNVDAFTPGTTPKNLNFQAADIADFLTESGLVERRPETGALFDDTFVKEAAAQ
jgi:NitT/TauT family transport system substrate-binding protein